MPKKKKKIQSPDTFTPLGKLYLEAQSKDHGSRTIGDVSEDFTKDYMDNVIEAAIKGKRRHVGPYFVVVIMKRERIMKKVLRNFFITRKSCPTPNHDQTVYSFDPVTEDLKLIWVIPDEKMCRIIYNDRFLVNSRFKELVPYVVDFIEKRLYMKCKELNGETNKPGYVLETL